MKTTISSTIKLALAAAALVLVAYILYRALQPAVTVDSLIQSVNRDASYQKLERALESNNAKDRLKAVKALLILQTDEACDLLGKAARDTSVVVRVALVQGLQSLPERKALPLILQLLDDKEFVIVRGAINALEKKTGSKYEFRLESSPEEKTAIIAQCKRDIVERLKE